MTFALGSQSCTTPEPVVWVPRTLHWALFGIWGVCLLIDPTLLGHAAVPTQSLVLCLATQQLVVNERASLFLISAFLKACMVSVRTVVGLPRKCVFYICIFFPLFLSHMTMTLVLFWMQHL